MFFYQQKRLNFFERKNNVYPRLSYVIHFPFQILLYYLRKNEIFKGLSDWLQLTE